jgi:hypothetical protein
MPAGLAIALEATNASNTVEDKNRSMRDIEDLLAKVHS